MPRKPSLHADPRTQLHFGLYQAPALHVGDRVTCLLRDADCVVTSWTDALVPWAAGPGSRLAVDLVCSLNDALAGPYAESAAAVMHWWGVGAGAVWSCARALGVGRKDNEGTMELMQAAAEKGAAAVQAREFTQAERRARCRIALRLNQGQYLHHGYHGPRWTAEAGPARNPARCRRGRDRGQKRQRGPAAAGEERHSFPKPRRRGLRRRQAGAEVATQRSRSQDRTHAVSDSQQARHPWPERWPDRIRASGRPES